MIPQGVQLQVVLRNGQALFFTPPEQFNFVVFVKQCIEDGYFIINQTFFVDMSFVGWMGMGEVKVEMMIPQPQGTMQ